MRLTLRRNGQYMATVRVTHHIDVDDVVNLLCFTHRLEAEEGEILNRTFTKAHVEKAVHDTLQFDGISSPGYWRDDVEDDLADEIEAHVKAEVIRLYPDFAKGA